MKPGDKVMVPPVGMGYKTVKLSELRPVKEVSNSDY
jgi:hypothetical protein